MPLPDTDYLSLNTHVPPFDDVRVRRAVNFAIDRHAVARLFGGPKFATPTCQLVPATVPGHEPYCPYTRSPSRKGRWVAPDLPRAHRLIAASGTRGTAVTVWTQPGLPNDEATGRYFGRLLARLGYRARVRVLAHPRWVAVIDDPRRHPQVVTQGWIDSRASAFISLSFGCAAWNPPAEMSNHAEFCDPAVDRLCRAAERLEATDPVAANRLWARADRRVTDAAPAVATVQESSPDLLSRRAGDYQSAPSIGVVLQRLWVR